MGSNGSKKLVNHFERHDCLTTKDGLFFNLQKFCESSKLDVFDFLPIQFVLDFSEKSIAKDTQKFWRYFNAIEKQKYMREDFDLNAEISSIIASKATTNYQLLREMYAGANVWLIKPNDFNRGRGVRLFSSLDQLRILIREFTQASFNKELYYLKTVVLN